MFGTHASRRKSHTLTGTPQAPGVTPRALAELFRLAAASKGRIDLRVRCMALELYQDTLVDLLLPAGGREAPPRLEIKRDTKGWVSVLNATLRDCGSLEELTACLAEGAARRKTAHTLMNADSSRSHALFSVQLEATDAQTQAVSRGKLSFVDLAGSERLKKSGASGEQLREAQAINLSLSALGNVISALAGEAAHVPYRDHKLTMLMSDSLGGSAKTLMIVNVSPSDSNLEETQNSLGYAVRARTIKNDPLRNLATREIRRLEKLVELWRARAGQPGGAEELGEVENGTHAEAAAA